ncbi:hypothetical protein [Marinobacter alkaliphilus]|uniref:hypothetical protein n=1 Tax=Marinobacter alkaliphilus TaxID=254719 RepID=UPI003D7672B7
MEDFELVKQHTISNGEVITIAIDEDECSILVFNEKNEKIGNIDLKEVDDGFYITWMYLDQINPRYTHKGIGREALKFFKEVYRTGLYAAPNDGHVRSDGSHLTGDAPGFISKMAEEGIIGKFSY